MESRPAGKQRTASNLLFCDLCSATFRRAEHLQRHLASHSGGKPWKCGFCSQSFNRRDVLGRHWRTCKTRLLSGAPIPEFSRRRKGKKKQACDRCVRIKRACNAEYPCASCLEKNQECTYLRVLGMDHPIESSDSPVDTETLSLVDITTKEGLINKNFDQSLQDFDLSLSTELVGYDSQKSQWNELFPTQAVYAPVENSTPWNSYISLDPTLFEPSGDAWEVVNNSRLWKMDYLFTFTSTTGIVRSFECGTSDQRDFVLLVHIPNLHDLSATYLANSPPNITTSGSFPTSNTTFGKHSDHHPWTYGNIGLLEDAEKGDDSPTMSKASLSNISAQPNRNITNHFPSHDTLVLKSQEIVEGLRDTIMEKPKKSPISLKWSTVLENVCSQFFSPLNLERFLLLFWSGWYPNCPILHRPTFSISKSSTSLITSMAIIGACISTDENDHNGAELWFDAVEEMVFNADGFIEDYAAVLNDGLDISEHRNKLDALRAAYFVCLYQSWDGSEKGRRRCRRLRYAQVVAAARSLQLSSRAHDTILQFDHTELGWKRVMMREEITRTIIYVFLLDCGYAIFHNTPPRMVVSELEVAFACPEICFQCESLDQFESTMDIWSQSKFVQQGISLSAAVCIFCKEMSQEMKETFAQASALNMFVIVSAFHSLIFHFQSIPNVGLETPILMGLQNWKFIWAAHVMCDPYESSELVDPRDLWKKTGFMRHALEFLQLAYMFLKQSATSSGMDNMDLNHYQIEGFKPPPSSRKYDETGMGQVHNLIKSFQNVSLDI